VNQRITNAWAPWPLGLLRAIAVIVAACVTATGCNKPHAAESNLAQTEDETRTRATLEDQHRREAVAAMRSVAEGATIQDRPTTAPRGRWSDVPRAASRASRAIEAAVVREFEENDGQTWRFVLKTIEDLPGELVVHRDPETVYRAEASIGFFPEAARSIERRDALLEAFDDAMRVFGQKRAFEALP